MTWGRILPLSSIPSFYVKTIGDTLKEISVEGSLKLELWPRDSPVSFITQREFGGYLRGVQVAFWEDENGWFVSLVPLFLSLDLNKRKILRAQPSVILTIVQRLYFSQPYAIKTETTDQNLVELLREKFRLVWINSYDLKPIHLTVETEMGPQQFLPR